MWATAALELFCDSLKDGALVLDVGSGKGEHSRYMKGRGLAVMEHDVSRAGVPYEQTPERPCKYDGIWCSHTLEHMRSPGSSLDKMRVELKPGGLLAVTVPPTKQQIVGGHCSHWPNVGALVYALILSGFDCSGAAVKTYGYNMSVLVRKPVDPLRLPKLAYDSGDIHRLRDYFPFPVHEGFNGWVTEANWRPL